MIPNFRSSEVSSREETKVLLKSRQEGYRESFLSTYGKRLCFQSLTRSFVLKTSPIFLLFRSPALQKYYTRQQNQINFVS